MYGVVMAVYGLVCMLVFERAMEDMINGVRSESLDLSTEWWWVAAPPLWVLFDLLTATLYETREAPIIWLLKAVIATVYYTAPFVMLNGHGAAVNTGRRALEMALTLFFVSWSTGYFVWLRRKTRLE